MFFEIEGKYHQALDGLTELANMLHVFTNDPESMEGMKREGQRMVREMKDTVNKVVNMLENVGDGDLLYYLDTVKNYRDELNSGRNPVFASEAAAECIQGFYGGEVRRHRRFVYEWIPEGKQSTIFPADSKESRKAA